MVSQKLNLIEFSRIRQIYQYKKEDTIDLGLGQLIDLPPTRLIDEGVKALTSGKVRYTPNAGIEELRTLIARESQSHTQQKVDLNEVIVTCGVEEALLVVFLTLLDDDSEILIPDIHFTAYKNLAALCGAKIQYYRLDHEFNIDFVDLEKKITPNSKLILINTPANPTGKILDQAALQRLAALVSQYPNLHILSDEVYQLFTWDNYDFTSIMKFTRQSIIVNGLSKRAAIPGLRLGWIILPGYLFNDMLKVHQYCVSCASSISQYAAVPVLKNLCRDYEQTILKRLSQNRDLIRNELTGFGQLKLSPMQGSFYCFIHTGQYGPSQQVAHRILEKGNTLVIPGIAFGEKGDQYIRLSFSGEAGELHYGLKKIKEVLKNEN